MNENPEPVADTDPPTDADLTAIITPLSALSTGMSRVIAGKPAVNRLALLQAVRYTPGIRPSR